MLVGDFPLRVEGVGEARFGWCALFHQRVVAISQLVHVAGLFLPQCCRRGALLREGRCRKEAAFLPPLFVGWVRRRLLCLFVGVLPGRRVCVPRGWA